MSEEIVLLERKSAGLLVEVILDPEGVYLAASTDAAHFCVSVPGNAVLDAFEHPCYYIARAGEQPGELFPRACELDEDETEALPYDQECEE